MAERKIEIQMAAVGAAETATQIGETTRSVKDLTEATEGQNEATEKSATAARQDTQIGIQRAAVLQNLARGLRDIAGVTADLAERFRETDAATAEALDNIAGGLETAGSMGEYAAKGMALAGPAGAAVGAAWGAAEPQIRKFTDAFLGIVEGLAEVEQSFENVLNLGAEMSGQNPFRAATKGASEAKEATDAFAESMAAAAAVDPARRAAEQAEAKAEDEAAIRDGADPQAVKRARIAKDAAGQRGQVSREINNAAILRAGREMEVEKVGGQIEEANLAGMDTTGLTDQLDAAKAELAEARKREAGLLAAAPFRNREIAAKESAGMGRADDADRRESQRREREEEAVAAKHADDNDRLEKAAARDAERRETARATGARRTGAGAEGIADAAFTAGASGGFVADLRRRAAAVQDNPSAGNEAALAQLLDQLLRSLETGKGQDAASAAELKRRIVALERREKNR